MAHRISPHPERSRRTHDGRPEITKILGSGSSLRFGRNDEITYMGRPGHPDNCRTSPCPASAFRLQSRKPREDAMSSNLEHAATDPGGPTGRLATWLAGLTLDAVPAK